MTYLLKRRSPHSGRLERWLGADKLAKISADMANGGGIGNKWYGAPINIRDVPGSVWVTGDGDYCGDFDRGFFMSAADSFSQHVRDLWRAAGKPLYLQHQQSPSFGGGIAKVGPTGVTNVSSSLWRVGTAPAAGAAGSAAPGGRALTDATTGTMAFNNPASGTLHLVGADMAASVASNTLMLYDRIFDVAKTMASTATESVTGVPTRYQSSTPANADYAGSNFLFIEVGTPALSATAHNWTVCTYRNQAGTDAQTLPSVTGNSAAIVDRFDMPVMSWFCPLASGDSGIMDLAQMQCSASVAAGAINFVIGHPLGIMSFPIASATYPFDWLTNKAQAPRIFDDAACALFEMNKPGTTTCTYNGRIEATSAAA
jgi:hypothetical protein